MLALFLVGFAVGVVLSFATLFVSFFYPQALLDNFIRKKTIKHTELKAVAREAAKLPPVKVESLVTIARYDGGVTGEATRCRVVLYGNTVHVYRIDELERLQDQRQIVKKEVLLGKINASCVEATGEHISKYHRHRNKSSRFSSIKGKCLILCAHDGMPLFVEDPAVKQRKLLARVRRDQERRALAKTMEQLVDAGTGDEALRLLLLQQQQQQDEQRHTSSPGATAHTPSREAHDPPGPHRPPRDAAAPQAHQPFFINALDVRRAKAAAAAEAPVSEWRRVALKFPTRRIHERWLTLLQSNTQSMQWRDFLRHLPQIDVLNLLIARLFYENLRTSSFQELIERKIQEKLFKVSRSLPPHLRGNITLENLTLGGEIPLIDHVSEAVVSPEGDLEFDFDVLYRGGLVISLRFAITYRRIRLPDMIFHIKVLELSGRMRFNIAPPPTTKFWLSGPKPPQLRLEFTQEMASPEGVLSVLMGLIPDLSAIATNVVKVMLFEDMVLPNFDDFPWPVLAGQSSDEDNKAAKANYAATEQSPSDMPWAAHEMGGENNDTHINAYGNHYVNDGLGSGVAPSPSSDPAFVDVPYGGAAIAPNGVYDAAQVPFRAEGGDAAAAQVMWQAEPSAGTNGHEHNYAASQFRPASSSGVGYDVAITPPSQATADASAYVMPNGEGAGWGADTIAAAAEAAAEGFVPLSAADQSTLMHGGRKTWTLTTSDLFPTYPHTTTTCAVTGGARGADRAAVSQPPAARRTAATTTTSSSPSSSSLQQRTSRNTGSAGGAGRQADLHFVSGGAGQTVTHASYNSSGFLSLLRNARLLRRKPHTERGDDNTGTSAHASHATTLQTSPTSAATRSGESSNAVSPSYSDQVTTLTAKKAEPRLRVMAPDVL